MNYDMKMKSRTKNFERKSQLLGHNNLIGIEFEFC